MDGKLWTKRLVNGLTWMVIQAEMEMAKGEEMVERAVDLQVGGLVQDLVVLPWGFRLEKTAPVVLERLMLVERESRSCFLFCRGSSALRTRWVLDLEARGRTRMEMARTIRTRTRSQRRTSGIRTTRTRTLRKNP